MLLKRGHFWASRTPFCNMTAKGQNANYGVPLACQFWPRADISRAGIPQGVPFRAARSAGPFWTPRQTPIPYAGSAICEKVEQFRRMAAFLSRLCPDPLGRERFKPAGVRAGMPQPGAARPMTEETTISPDTCLAEKTLAEIEAEIRKTLEALAAPSEPTPSTEPNRCAGI